MKSKVLRYDKCMFCGAINSYIVRDSFTNKNVSDNGIHNMIICHNDNAFKHCSYCNKHTKQETVAWDIYEQEEED